MALNISSVILISFVNKNLKKKFGHSGHLAGQ